MPSSFKIGKIAGIEIGVHWSWLFIFVLVTWSFATGILEQFFPEWSEVRRWVVGAIVSGIFFVSILLHELSHSLVAKARGIEVKGITLFIFGGVSTLEREARSAGEEFQIAIVGPLTSLVIGAMFAVAWAVLRGPAPGVGAVAGYLAFINGVIAAFNMLPGFPLDGGRVFRSIVWWRNRDLLRATRISAKTGEYVAYLLMGLGVVQFVTFNPIGGLWMVLIGWFLRGASAGSYQQMVSEVALEGVMAGDVARRDYVTVTPTMTIAELVDEHLLSGHGRCFPVVAGDELLGLITLTDIRHLERERWQNTSVYRAMTPFEQLRTVSSQDDAKAVLQTMGEGNVNQVPVVDGRWLVGMVSRADILRLIQVRHAMTSGE